MYNIYCLVNSLDNKPFYVGVTVLKIHLRLCGHLSELKTYPVCNYNQKMTFIADIIANGGKIRTRLLKTVPLHEVDYYEQFFYNMLLGQGFTLINRPTSFCYSKKRLTDKNKVLNNQYVKKYMQLRYKNILILIW